MTAQVCRLVCTGQSAAESAFHCTGLRSQGLRSARSRLRSDCLIAGLTWHACIITFSQCRPQVSDPAVHAAIRQPLAQDFVALQVHMSKLTIMQHCQSLQQKQYSSAAATLTVFMQAIVWLGKHKRVHMLCSLRCMSLRSVEKKRKDYAFRRQFNEKPSIPSCRGHSSVQE